MAEVTVQLPEDLSIVMRRHASINWSGIAEEAIILGKKVKKGMWEKVYKKLA